MKLFTSVEIPLSKYPITHRDNILLIGSCFTNEIGQRLSQYGYNIMINPFGIIYNPLSIVECLLRVAKREYFLSQDLVFNNQLYYCFACHGDFCSSNEKDTLKLINDSIDKANEFLQQTTYIILTLGTAWTYWYKPLNRLMANCHKIDSKLIDRQLLSVDTITCQLQEMIQYIEKKFNNKIKFIFTLSPIRHWAEGYKDNLLSKSTLNLSINNIIENQNNCADYFPSYEIVMDELRDYRFYAPDLLHINSLGVDIIWEKFVNTFFSQQEKILSNKFFKLYQMKNHRPINPNTEQYQQLLIKIKDLEKELVAFQAKS